MNTAEFMESLRQRGVDLWLEGDRLRYRAPRAVLTPELLDELKTRKDEMIAALKQPVAYPLSAGQRALWYLHRLDPDSAAYHVAFAARIRGAVDTAALRQAFQTLADRHPALRTVFAERDDGVVQIVQADQPVDFTLVDATDATDSLSERVAQAYRQPFDLTRGPLFRVTLVSRDAQDHGLLLCAHHGVCDAWSLWRLLDELRLSYPAALAGSPAPAPTESRVSYRDYARWQERMLAGADGERLWNFWSERLAGELPLLELPTDRPRPPVQTFNGASRPFSLTGEASRAVKTLAQQQGVTLYMLLLAVYQVLLHRYSGQDDLLLGCPTAGRTHGEFDGLVGYLVNPVVVRTRFVGNPSFADLLNDVRQTTAAALAHQDYPFALLVERLQGERDPSRPPVFQAAFVLQQPPRNNPLSQVLTPGGGSVDWGGLPLEFLELRQQEGQFDLMLEAIEAGDALHGLFKYNADLFDASTIERMIGHFKRLLASAVDDPRRRVSISTCSTRPNGGGCWRIGTRPGQPIIPCIDPCTG